jgi:hypothetical protein
MLEKFGESGWCKKSPSRDWKKKLVGWWKFFSELTAGFFLSNSIFQTGS